MTFGSGGGWTNITRTLVTYNSSGSSQLLYQCPANTMAFISLSHLQSNSGSFQATARLVPLALGGYPSAAATLFSITTAGPQVRFITRANMNIASIENFNRLVGYGSSAPWIYVGDSERIEVDITLLGDTGSGIVFQLLEQSIS